MNLDDEVTLAPVPEPEKPWVAYVCYDYPDFEGELLTFRTLVTVIPVPKRKQDPLGIIRRGLMQDGLVLANGLDWVPPHAIRRVWMAKES